MSTNAAYQGTALDQIANSASQSIKHVEPIGEIPQALNGLEGNIDVLTDRMARLVSMMDPVLGSDSPSDAQTNGFGAPCSAPLAGEIGRLAAKVRAVSAMVDSATERLCL